MMLRKLGSWEIQLLRNHRWFYVATVMIGGFTLTMLGFRDI